jgi:hypothetical protein
MFQFTESIIIASRPDEIWETLVDFEKWWPPSNPEHISIDVHYDGKPIDVGTEVNFEERIAGIKGKASGSITKWIPECEATWEGAALYSYYGIPIRVREGVSWSIESIGSVSTLSATIWAQFPVNLIGRLVEWYSVRFLNVIDRDKEHARCELEYLKSVFETNG